MPTGSHHARTSAVTTSSSCCRFSQLFDVAAPAPQSAEVEKDPLAFDDLDATAYLMAARVAVSAQVGQIRTYQVGAI